MGVPLGALVSSIAQSICRGRSVAQDRREIYSNRRCKAEKSGNTKRHEEWQPITRTFVRAWGRSPRRLPIRNRTRDVPAQRGALPERLPWALRLWSSNRRPLGLPPGDTLPILLVSHSVTVGRTWSVLLIKDRRTHMIHFAAMRATQFFFRDPDRFQRRSTWFVLGYTYLHSANISNETDLLEEGRCSIKSSNWTWLVSLIINCAWLISRLSQSVDSDDVLSELVAISQKF